jgi:hypothetical protein
MQCRKVRHASQFQGRHQARTIAELTYHAAVIGLEKVLQYEAGEQLMLRELLRTKLVCVKWQRATSRRQGC